MLFSPLDGQMPVLPGRWTWCAEQAELALVRGEEDDEDQVLCLQESLLSSTSLLQVSNAASSFLLQV